MVKDRRQENYIGQGKIQTLAAVGNVFPGHRITSERIEEADDSVQMDYHNVQSSENKDQKPRNYKPCPVYRFLHNNLLFNKKENIIASCQDENGGKHHY